MRMADSINNKVKKNVVMWLLPCKAAKLIFTVHVDDNVKQ